MCVVCHFICLSICIQVLIKRTVLVVMYVLCRLLLVAFCLCIFIIYCLSICSSLFTCYSIFITVSFCFFVLYIRLVYFHVYNYLYLSSPSFSLHIYLLPTLPVAYLFLIFLSHTQGKLIIIILPLPAFPLKFYLNTILLPTLASHFLPSPLPYFLPPFPIPLVFFLSVFFFIPILSLPLPSSSPSVMSCRIFLCFWKLAYCHYLGFISSSSASSSASPSASSSSSFLPSFSAS